MNLALVKPLEIEITGEDEEGQRTGHLMGSLDPLGWEPPSFGMSFEQCEDEGATLSVLQRGSTLGIGDWLNHTEILHGERYTQAAEITGMSEDYLMDIKWITGKVPKSKRLPGLTLSHYRLVAALPEEDRFEWLERTAAENWSKRQLKSELKIAAEGKEKSTSEISNRFEFSDDEEPAEPTYVVESEPASFPQIVSESSFPEENPEPEVPYSMSEGFLDDRSEEKLEQLRSEVVDAATEALRGGPRKNRKVDSEDREEESSELYAMRRMETYIHLAGEILEQNGADFLLAGFYDDAHRERALKRLRQVYSLLATFLKKAKQS